MSIPWAVLTFDEQAELTANVAKYVGVDMDPEAYWDSLDSQQQGWRDGFAQRQLGVQWGQPVPVSRESMLPTFPVEVFPLWVGEFVDALSIATQTPIDLPAVLALTALSAVAGGRVVVEVRPGWVEPVNLYGAVAMAPGNRKTPVAKAITDPLFAVEKALAQDSLAGIHEAETRKAIAENAARDKAREAAGDNNKLDDALAAAAMAEAISVPVQPRLLADDCTPEALASLMATQGGRIATLSDEGGVFDLIAGRYSGMANLDLYLKGHSGTPHRIDRKGRPAEFIERPALTVGLAVQPEVLRTIADRPGFRGRGLLARFLYSLPLSPLGRRRIGAPPVPEEVQKTYSTNLQALVHSLSMYTDPVVIALTPDAREAVAEVETALEPQLGIAGELASVADWASKLVGQMVRVCALLHLATHLNDGWSKAIGVETLRHMSTLVGYFTQHALAVFEVMSADQLQEDAAYVLQWLRGHNRDRFTARDLYTANRSRFPTAESVGPVLEHLESYGWVHPLPAPERDGPGRPASRPWAVNPLNASAESA